MWIRAYSSIWMIGGFAFIIYVGHLCITAMIVVIQIYMAKELFNLLRKAREDSHLPGFRLLNWLLPFSFHFVNWSVWLKHSTISLLLTFLIFAFMSLIGLRHFFFTAMLFVYGRILSQRLVNTLNSDQFLYQLVSSLIKYHMVICYFLYIAGWSCILHFPFYLLAMLIWPQAPWQSPV